MVKNMEESIDEILFNKKTIKKQSTNEEKADLKDLLEQEDVSTADAVDATSKESKKTAKNKKPDGQKVLEVSMTIDGVDQGSMQIGENEYATLTDMSALFDLYDIDAKNMSDPEKTVKSFVLSAQEFASQTGKNSISIMMQSNKDETFSINVLVNEIGQTFNEIEKAINYFNSQYQQNILDIINKEIQ